MRVCHACGRSMLGNPLLCRACGSLLSAHDIETIEFEIRSHELETAPKLGKKGRSAQVDPSGSIKVHIGEKVQTIILTPELTVILGRGDAEQGYIDLTAYDARENGVSRRHAALKLQDETLLATDLESTNGTFLNGQRLDATKWDIVHDGDQLRLGKLVITLKFD